MAGHSQFKNIMHRKGKVDAVRSKVFSKLAREITVAAKMGMPDPAMNPRLRAAILAARAENMPKENIQRAINKASGGDAENYDEIRYEGYGPGGAAIIVEAMTDNRNRTASDIRSYFTKSGGNLAEMLDKLAHVIRERFRLRAKTRAVTAEGRAQAVLLLVLPIALLFIFMAMSDVYADSLAKHPNIIWAALAAESVGAVWIRKIVNFDF